MKQLLTFLFFFTFSGLAISQVDTIGEFTFSEKVRNNFYETSQPIWQSTKHGDFFIKLSARRMNIYASFRLDRKSEWLGMIERFEELHSKNSSSSEIMQMPLNYPIKTEIVRFRFFGDTEYHALKPTLNFVFVSGLNGNNTGATMLVIEVPKLVDSLDETYSLDGFNLYLTDDHVKELKDILSRIKE